jgi:hypothetical protein
MTNKQCPRKKTRSPNNDHNRSRTDFEEKPIEKMEIKNFRNKQCPRKKSRSPNNDHNRSRTDFEEKPIEKMEIKNFSWVKKIQEWHF